MEAVRFDHHNHEVRMTKALKEAFEAASKLPDAEQDALACSLHGRNQRLA